MKILVKTFFSFKVKYNLQSREMLATELIQSNSNNISSSFHNILDGSIEAINVSAFLFCLFLNR